MEATGGDKRGIACEHARVTPPKIVAIAATALVAAGLSLLPSTTSARTAAPASSAPAAASFQAAPVDWSRCRDASLRQAKAQCGYLTVPVDHADPGGPTIRLAVSRILHTEGPYRGAVFVNPGGPGASGLQYSRLGGGVPRGGGRT